MEKLFKVLKDYNTFRINGKLMLGVTVDEPCYNGNPDTVIPRIYPGQPVFIVDTVLRWCPFIGCKDIKWNQNENIIDVNAVFQDYENDCEFNDDFHIECFIDISRKDNIDPCKHKKITPDILKHHNYIDIDQSRYIDGKKYYVVDLFKLGKFSKDQRNQLEQLFIDLNDRKLHNRSATIYYTDEDEFGLWDYLKAEPYKNF